MAGIFELFVDAEAHIRFQLKAPDGTVIAVSRAFEDKPAAVAGIAATRECAGTGLITDLSKTATRPDRSTDAPASSVPPAPRTRTKAGRRAALEPRWRGAA